MCVYACEYMSAMVTLYVYVKFLSMFTRASVCAHVHERKFDRVCTCSLAHVGLYLYLCLDVLDTQ